MTRLYNYSEHLKHFLDELAILEHLPVKDKEKQLQFIIHCFQSFQKDIQKTMICPYDARLNNSIGSCICLIIKCIETPYKRTYNKSLKQLVNTIETSLSSVLNVIFFFSEFE